MTNDKQKFSLKQISDRLLTNSDLESMFTKNGKFY